MTVAIYPGSFDPITNGHLDIAARAAAIFERLIIAIYQTPSKNLLFTTEERVAMAREAVAHLPNVQVEGFSGLIIDYTKRAGARAIVRGLRATSDFEREFEMALMNKNLAPEIEVVCLMTGLEHQFISSSLLKEVASLGGCITNLVPPCVAQALQEKLHRIQPEKGGV